MSTVNRPILFVTNDPKDVFVFWRYHKECGIQNRVEVFQDGEDVLRYLQSANPKPPAPALLVLSLKMPRMGGMRVLEHLKATGQNGFPTALLVAARDYDVPLAVMAYRLWVERFISSPIDKKEFCSLMSQFPAITIAGCCDANTDTEPQTPAAAPSTPDCSAAGLPGHAGPEPQIPDTLQRAASRWLERSLLKTFK